MRNRIGLAITISALAVLGTTSVVQAAPTASPFSGHWAATDPLDGSNLDAYVFGGSHPQILYTDDAAPGTCGDTPDQTFTSLLTATVDGSDLNSTMRWARCGTVRLPFGGFEITWTLDDRGDDDPSNDELTNAFGETYARVS